MAHTVLLKRSSTTSAVPTGVQLSAGELALNTADEKLFFKNSSGTVKSLSAMSDLTSNLVTISTTQTITGTKTFGAMYAASLELQTVGGDEGGQLDFGLPATNTTLSSGVAIDVYQNRIRFFEKGGSSRGFYIDLTSGGAGVSTNLVGGGGGGTPGGSDTYVQFNDGGSTFGGDAGLTYNKTTDSLTVSGDLAVNGGDITTSSAGASLFNNTATTINIGNGSATSVTIGANANNASVSVVGGVMQFKRTGSGMAYYSEIIDGSASGMNIGGSLSGAPITIGDYNAANNSTNIVVDDSSGTISFYTGTGLYAFPTSNGSNGQVLTTNGAGVLSWATPAGGGSGVSAAFTIAMAIAL